MLWFEEKSKAANFEKEFPVLRDKFAYIVGSAVTEYDRDGKVFYYGTEKAIEDFTK